MTSKTHDVDGAAAIVERDGAVVTVTFNRPDTLNAFSSAMAEVFTDALRDADHDDTVRAVVVTGSGRAFCAGADFSSSSDPFAAPRTDTFSSDPLDRFHPWECRKPVIAAINGHAIGIGLTLTLQCDIRIVATDAKLGFVQTRRGVLSDAHSHWTLPRLVGYSRATELLLTGRTFRGSDAATWGLATEALPATDVLPAAHRMAEDLAVNTAPLSVALSKRLLWQANATPARVNQFERDAHLHLMGSSDAREGVSSYLEKRPPSWSGSVTDDWPTGIDDPSGQP